MASVTEHQGTAVLDIGALLDAGDGAVVTLVAGKTRLAAHKAVLAAGSPVFAAMFAHDMQEASSGEVNILDVEGPVLRQLLANLYTGRAPNLPGLAPQLLAAADKYGVSALKDACEQQVAAQLDVESAAASAVLSVLHSCHSLRRAATTFIKQHPLVIATQGWADAVRDHPEDVVEFTRLLAELPEGTSTTAATDSSSTTTAPAGWSHGDHGATPAAASCHTPLPVAALISCFQSLSPQDKGRRLLQVAEEGALQELQALLAAGADAGARGEVGITALHLAALRGDVEAAKCLLQAGAVVDARNDNHYTPLHLAACEGHTAVVRLLLASSADPSVRDEEGWSPLHWAASRGHPGITTELMEAGASSYARNGDGKTALDLGRELKMQTLMEMVRRNPFLEFCKEGK